MTFIVWILFGAAIGLIVSILFDQQREYRTPHNVIVSMAGSVTGGAMAVAASGGLYAFNLLSVILAVTGGFVALGAYRKLAFGRVGG